MYKTNTDKQNIVQYNTTLKIYYPSSISAPSITTLSLYHHYFPSCSFLSPPGWVCTSLAVLCLHVCTLQFGRSPLLRLVVLKWSTMVHFTSWCNLARAPPPSRLLLISRRALEVNCRQVIFNLLLSFVTKLQTSENSSDLVYLPLP